MSKIIDIIMEKTTDDEKYELFQKLTMYIVANADCNDTKNYIDFFDALGYVHTHMSKFDIGTHKKADCWK